MSNPVLLKYGVAEPDIDPSVFIAPNATVIGKTEIGKDSSVWFGAVLRGDICPIKIGYGSNIQDGVIIHGDEGRVVEIGDGVTIGHRAIVHGCKVGNGALIGMGAIILDGAVIGEQALIGAGALVPPGKVIPPRTLWMGAPAKMVRDMNEEALKSLEGSAKHYREQSVKYSAQAASMT